ncbi:MAG: Na(+)-translocating NADH-quinone reductase subunit C [Cellulophaga sp.]
MAIDTSKNSYTILFSIGMVVVVGGILAFLAASLKPTIKKNEIIEVQQNILYAMGINDNQNAGDIAFISTDVVEEEFKKYIKSQVVITGATAIEDDKAYLISVKTEQKLAKDPSHKRRLPLFIGEKDGKAIYVAPIRGKGLWDAIWGYVAMDKDMVVQGVFFDHKGETPGLGANIKQRYFMDDYTGEYLMAGDTFKGIAVAKGNNDPKNTDKTDNEVDALAGATITGDGVAAMVKSDLKLYVPYFNTLKNK